MSLSPSRKDTVSGTPPVVPLERSDDLSRPGAIAVPGYRSSSPETTVTTAAPEAPLITAELVDPTQVQKDAEAVVRQEILASSVEAKAVPEEPNRRRNGWILGATVLGLVAIAIGVAVPISIGGDSRTVPAPLIASTVSMAPSASPAPSAGPTAGPNNDFCDEATPVRVGGTYSGDLAEATLDVNHTFVNQYERPLAAGYGQWFSFVASGHFVSAELCADSSDVQLRVLTGSCDKSFEAWDPSVVPGGCGKRHSFLTTQGLRYWIYVMVEEQRSGETTPFNLTFHSNEECEYAFELDDRPELGITSSLVGGIAVNAPACDDIPAPVGAGVWYRLQRNRRVGIQLSTCRSEAIDTKISVYTGSCGALECVAANDDDDEFCGPQRSLVSFVAEPFRAYYVLVHGGLPTTSGPFLLDIDQIESNIRCPQALEVVDPREMLFGVDITRAWDFDTNVPEFTQSCDGVNVTTRFLG